MTDAVPRSILIPPFIKAFFGHSSISVKARPLGRLAFGYGIPYYPSATMLRPEQTVRQRIMDLITDAFCSSRQLAELTGISERQVEDHLSHIVKSVARDHSRRFLLQSSACHKCGFMFRKRTRLTRPSRCPACRSESISPPSYKIEAATG
jgi:predicted Zn-ribbon and HTH transcriptional regulator